MTRTTETEAPAPSEGVFGPPSDHDLILTTNVELTAPPAGSGRNCVCHRD